MRSTTQASHPRLRAGGRRQLSIAACAAVAAVACAGTGAGVDEPLLVASHGAVEITAGDSLQLVATVARDAPSRRVVWRSNSPTVATVDSLGWLRTHDAGAAIIEVEIAGVAGSGTSVPVTVHAPCALAVPLTGAPPSLTLSVGATGRPPVSVGACRPGADSTIVYESSDTTVVAIDRATGLPMGRQTGSAVVTVRLRAAPSRRVEVAASVALTCFTQGITVRPGAVAIVVGDSARLEVSIPVPPGAPVADRPRTTFVSSDAEIASVSDAGVIRGRRAGSATVTVGTSPASTSRGCPYGEQRVPVTVSAP